VFPVALEHASEHELWEVRTRAGDVLAFQPTPEMLAGMVGEIRIDVADGCQVGSSSCTGQVIASPRRSARSNRSPWPSAAASSPK
jgi:hypothetical protein